MANRKPKRLASQSKAIRSGRAASGHLGFETFTARDLQAMKFPPLKYSVDGIIVEGITLLAGKPKLGKSWMALNIAMAVASGGLALGTIQCKKGPVLYAALSIVGCHLKLTRCCHRDLTRSVVMLCSS
ncbi:AAA family ATPase [Sulfitobacter sp. HGT1]|uniref:AAA family ATPase n=1 Tax=Sulfitobacter sp. HGT1 TaxID=2735435 RepID=UPI0015945AB0|nr:AAA family ATPase [Sulfitobacter sp. HGT1]